eukprot:280919-Hanusia_phi.AAC.1
MGCKPRTVNSKPVVSSLMAGQQSHDSGVCENRISAVFAKRCVWWPNKKVGARSTTHPPQTSDCSDSPTDSRCPMTLCHSLERLPGSHRGATTSGTPHPPARVMTVPGCL